MACTSGRVPILKEVLVLYVLANLQLISSSEVNCEYDESYLLITID